MGVSSPGGIGPTRIMVPSVIVVYCCSNDTFLCCPARRNDPRFFNRVSKVLEMLHIEMVRSAFCFSWSDHEPGTSPMWRWWREKTQGGLSSGTPWRNTSKRPIYVLFLTAGARDFS